MKTSLDHRTQASRRHFLKQLGSGMFLTTLGVGLTQELGLAESALGLATWSGEDPLGFGELGVLADLMAQTPLEDLQPRLVQQIEQGTSLSTLIAAGALANARAFGGEDYEGYHAFMALMPAYEMSTALTGRRAALPVLKVLYRNTARIQAIGKQKSPTLRAAPEQITGDAAGSIDGDELVRRVQAADKRGAEAAFDALMQRGVEENFVHLIPVVCQEQDVHRVVLAWRGWDLARLTGREHARTLLRQSIRQCVDREADNKDDPIRRVLPSVLEESGVLEVQLGRRSVDDAWIHACAGELADASRKQGTQLVADALKEGIAPEAIGEAISLAATHLMLRQWPRKDSSPGKPKGSVHGAGTGVHSSDTAAAWRGMSRFGGERQRKLALVAGGYHVAGQGGYVAPRHFAYDEVEVASTKREQLLGMLDECTRDGDQAGAAAAASCYGKLGYELDPILAQLHQASLAADGALHAEKYYRTQAEAIEGDRPAFRELHLAALARVCASQSFLQAAGREQALELVG